jgi:hypothetical protein
MTISRLLLKTAARYQQAVTSVLKTWVPDCGCERPGSQPQCQSCGCLPVFEDLVRSEVQALIHQESETASL